MPSPTLVSGARSPIWEDVGWSCGPTVTQLLRRELMLEIHVNLHADEQRPGIGEFDQNVGDAEIAEIACSGDARRVGC